MGPDVLLSRFRFRLSCFLLISTLHVAEGKDTIKVPRRLPNNAEVSDEKRNIRAIEESSWPALL